MRNNWEAGISYLGQLREIMQSSYKKLRRWYKRVDLSQKKHLLLPIHASGDHWFVIAVVNFDKLVKIAKGQTNREDLPSEE